MGVQESTPLHPALLEPTLVRIRATRGPLGRCCHEFLTPTATARSRGLDVDCSGGDVRKKTPTKKALIPSAREPQEMAPATSAGGEEEREMARKEH